MVCDKTQLTRKKYGFFDGFPGRKLQKQGVFRPLKQHTIVQDAQ